MTARQRLILARAEKRLTSHVAHHGIDDAALRLCERYEAEMADATVPPVEQRPDSVIDRIFRDVVGLGVGEVA